MTEENKGRREGIRDGLRQGVGILSAFKEAIEETIAEARDRGDLKPDRAKQAMRDALDKAQEAAGSARDRFDFVTQKDFTQLAETVSDLVRRVANLEGTAGEGPAEPEPPEDVSGEPPRDSPGGEAGEEDPADA